MSITKSAYTRPLRHPSSLHRFAQSELNAVAFDLLNWEGSRERIVSAWKQINAEVLTVQSVDDDEVAQLYDAVEKDVGEATAQHELEPDDSGTIDKELNEWYKAYVDLSTNYGFFFWPEFALTDYLRGFEGYDEAKARTIAQRAWATALMAYDARKSKSVDVKPAARNPRKKAKRKAS
ncbi:hypothetical protein [Stenotrophomonas muris]|uniref:hypothetical protein n=1 Tax=Stenotrophomonas muris TaxID=2963283 RepID=UPI002E78A67E|nr:hypothetical protein [Stenotrophomonas muris]